MEDPYLQCLAKGLFSTVLSSKAPSTAKKYMYAFNRWREWAQSLINVDIFPVTPVHLALYLQHLGNIKQSRAAVEEAAYAIAWAYQMAGLPSPSINPLVQTTLSGLRRVLAQPVVKKEPITPDMLEAMVRACGAKPSLSDVRFLAACLLGFAAFLRYEELSSLKCSDVLFFTEHMEIKIRLSKTDQLRQGDHVLVARSTKITCPVAMLECYMGMGGLSSSSGILFRPLAKGGEQLRSTGQLSHTRMRELLLDRLGSLGYSKSDFGVHSLRSGGATAAAQAGVPDRLFKRHGRWSSDRAKDGYVKDSVASLLEVSQGLGI